jgi:hypothetical protein
MGRRGRLRRELIFGGAVVLGVTAVAVALTAQGWRSRIPTFDLLTYIRSVHALLDSGAVPRYGDVGSYGSFSAPGTAWLMVPSTLLFDDPRLAEYAGTALLHGAALLGLFLLGRKFFGFWCGCLAVVLYGLSSSGLFQAGSLWPIGRPDFFIWTAYLATLWVTRRDPRFLAAAVAVWGIGMYVDMAITPIAFVFPVLWLVYRSPVRLGPLLVAAAVLVVVWFPYLRFEAPRHFDDIRSQLLLEYVFPADLRHTWCEPARPIHELQTGPAPVAASAAGAEAATGGGRSLVERAKDQLDERLLANFPDTRLPGARVLLLLMVLASMLAFGAGGVRGPPRRRARWERWLTPAAIAVVVCAFAARLLIPSVVDAGAPRTLGKLLFATALGVLIGRYAGRAVRATLSWARVAPPADDRTLLPVLCLGVPWFVLAVFSETGRPERFLWLWPLQILFLAAFATELLARLRVPRAALWIVPAALVFLLVDNTFLEARVRSWNQHGWSGQEARQIEVVDYVAGRLRARRRDSAAIGYRVFVYPFMAEYNAIDRRYKVGADFDLLLHYRRGITNTDTCPEGQSPNDEYRVVQTTPQADPEAPRSYFDVPRKGHFRLLREFGPYQVYARS